MLDDIPTIQMDLQNARKAFIDGACELKIEAMKINDSLDNIQPVPQALKLMWHES
jgi:hypothetical protein